MVTVSYDNKDFSYEELDVEPMPSRYWLVRKHGALVAAIRRAPDKRYWVEHRHSKNLFGFDTFEEARQFTEEAINNA